MNTKAHPSTLTDRYVWAAVRTVPAQQRDELDPEIRELVGDTIDARRAAGTPDGEAEREALVQLGDPELLAANYSDRPLQLIGPTFYLQWWRLLKTLLSTVVPIVAVVIAALDLLDQNRSLAASIGPAIGNAIGAGLNVTVHIVFWVTLTFAILDRVMNRTMNPATPRATPDDVRLGTVGRYLNVAMPWTPEQLPPVPSSSTSESSSAQLELGSNIAFAVLWGGALIWQAVASPVRNASGERIAVLRPDLWSFWLPFLLVIAAAEVVFWVVMHRSGGWNWTFAGLNLTLNLAFAVPAILLLLHGDLLNHTFFTAAGWPEGYDGTARIASVVIAAVASWDSVDGFIKARRAARVTG